MLDGGLFSPSSSCANRHKRILWHSPAPLQHYSRTGKTHIPPGSSQCAKSADNRCIIVGTVQNKLFPLQMTLFTVQPSSSVISFRNINYALVRRSQDSHQIKKTLATNTECNRSDGFTRTREQISKGFGHINYSIATTTL